MSDAAPPRPPREHRPNYWTSVGSVAVVLFTLGFFVLTVVNARLLIKQLKEQVNLIAELNSLGGEQGEALTAEINRLPYVREGSATFISKEEAAELMRKEFGDDFLKLDLPNPLYDVITFNVESAYMESDSLAKIRKRLIEREGVADVYYQENLIADIARNAKAIAWAALAILALFTAVAVALIHNTVRLALYANRFLIKNMELVGASWEFISRPFLKRAVWHGALSGLAAFLALMLLAAWVEQSAVGLSLLKGWSDKALLGGLLMLLGGVINALSTYYVVRKYLRMRVDDLY